LDFKVSDYVTSLFPPSFLEQKQRRRRARRLCQIAFNRTEKHLGWDRLVEVPRQGVDNG
jgi:hypothetical protein